MASFFREIIKILKEEVTMKMREIRVKSGSTEGDRVIKVLKEAKIDSVNYIYYSDMTDIGILFRCDDQKMFEIAAELDLCVVHKP